MNFLIRIYIALKQRKALLLCLGILILAVSVQAVTLSATGKVTTDIAWNLVTVSPEIAGDGPAFSSGSLVSPEDATMIVVERPEIVGGQGKDRVFRVMATLSSGAQISLKLSSMPIMWNPSNRSGSVTPLYTGYLTLATQGVSSDFVDIVFHPLGESVTFYVQYLLDADDVSFMGDSVITFTVIDMGEI
ncbi:hypothetical protein [Mesotoga sp.]|jgi:hypothetical protein|uniref:hypothetical protein n=1 Tax=Mesotoga sp. TaxID=2053577 RepID=UPI00345E45D0